MESSSIMEAVSLSDEEPPEPRLESGPEQSNLVNGSEIEDNPPAAFEQTSENAESHFETLEVAETENSTSRHSNPVILKKSDLNDPFNAQFDASTEEMVNHPVNSKVDYASKIIELQLKIEALETERGQLTSEILSKDNLITRLETENSSTKLELSELEKSHRNTIAEHERKFSQFSEETALKRWQEQRKNLRK